MKALLRLLLLVLVLHIQHAHSNPLKRQIPAEQGNCSKGWKYSTNSCYYYSDQQTTWAGARVSCKKLGGDLPSIHSSNENLFIVNLIPGTVTSTYTWLGLSDQDTENRWIWSDSTVTDFTKWYTNSPRQPNGGNKENCLGIDNGNKGWFDRPCNDKNRFVCKKPSTPGATLQEIRPNNMEKAFQCSFESDFCLMLNGSGDFAWIRNSGATVTSATGPSYAFDGKHYVYIETSSSRTEVKKAQLVTPTITNTCKSVVHFNYHMYGSTTDKLVVRAVNQAMGIDKTIFEISGNQGNMWFHGNASINGLVGDYQLVFEGFAFRSGNQGDIAIDNIEVFRVPKDNCTEFCDDPPDVAMASKVYNKVGYASSVTYTCPPGMTIFGTTASSKTFACDPEGGKWEFGKKIPVCEAACPTSLNVSGKSGVILSPGYPGTYTSNADCTWNILGQPKHKIIFEFDLFETEYLYDKLEIFNLYSGQKLGQLSGRIPPVIPTDVDKVRLKWTTDRNNGDKGFILRWKTTLCPEPNNTFNGFVNYTGLEKGDRVKYYCRSGYEILDNSEGVCIESGWSIPKPNCTIKSCPALSAPANGQLLGVSTFTYGENVQYQCNIGYELVGGQYRICLENATWSGEEATCKVVDCGFLVTPDFGKKFGEATLYQSVAEFTCQYGKESGDLRRVCLANGQWSGGITKCVDPIQCDFTQGFCGLIQDKTDNYDWIRIGSQTPSSGTGPNNYNGYYAYMETSSGQTGDKARLMSKEMLPTSSCYTLNFTYNMFGAGMGSLRVYQKDREGFLKETTKKVFERTGNQGINWHDVSLELDTDPYTFITIIFEAERGSAFTSDVAIDDIKMLDQCPSRSTVPPTTTTQPTTTQPTSHPTTQPTTRPTTQPTTSPTSTTSRRTTATTFLPTTVGTTTVTQDRTTNITPGTCYKTFQLSPSLSQKIESPYDVNCAWSFTDKTNTGYLTLFFTEFDLPPRKSSTTPGKEGTCGGNYLEINSSSMVDNTFSSMRICGNENVAGSDLVDRPTNVTLRLVNDGVNNNEAYKGFGVWIFNLA